MSTETKTISKEEFMTACLADGTARDVCENRWNAAHQTNPAVTEPKQSPGDAQLFNEIAMLKAQLKVREDQLKQAIEIAGRANDEKKAAEAAKKQGLISSILIDTPGYAKDALEQKSLDALMEIRTAIDKTAAPKFASVIAQMDAEKTRMKPKLTVGYFDSATKTWKGGI